MTYGASLLRAILDDPDSDAARLVYADHLEETGKGERAEFIRVQVELAKMPPTREFNRLCHHVEWKHLRDRNGVRFVSGSAGDGPIGILFYQASNPDHVALSRRERELLAGRDYEWFFPRGVLSEPAQWTFRRGFVASIACTTADFLAHAATLFAAQPITEVRLTDKRPDFWLGIGDNTERPPVEWDAHWFYDETGATEPWDIDHELCDHMPRWQFPFDEFNDAVTPEDAAYAALSRACVAYGRELVGLPPLSEDS